MLAHLRFRCVSFKISPLVGARFTSHGPSTAGRFLLSAARVHCNALGEGGRGGHHCSLTRLAVTHRALASFPPRCSPVQVTRVQGVGLLDGGQQAGKHRRQHHRRPHVSSTWRQHKATTSADKCLLLSAPVLASHIMPRSPSPSFVHQIEATAGSTRPALSSARAGLQWVGHAMPCLLPLLLQPPTLLQLPAALTPSAKCPFLPYLLFGPSYLPDLAASGVSLVLVAIPCALTAALCLCLAGGGEGRGVNTDAPSRLSPVAVQVAVVGGEGATLHSAGMGRESIGFGSPERVPSATEAVAGRQRAAGGKQGGSRRESMGWSLTREWQWRRTWSAQAAAALHPTFTQLSPCPAVLIPVLPLEFVCFPCSPLLLRLSLVSSSACLWLSQCFKPQSLFLGYTPPPPPPPGIAAEAEPEDPSPLACCASALLLHPSPLHQSLTLSPWAIAGTHGDGEEAALQRTEMVLLGRVSGWVWPLKPEGGSTGARAGEWSPHFDSPPPLSLLPSLPAAPCLDHSEVPPSPNPPLPTFQQPHHHGALHGSGRYSSLPQFLQSVPSLNSFPQLLPSVPSLSSLPQFPPSVPSLGSLPRFPLSVLSLSSFPQFPPSCFSTSLSSPATSLSVFCLCPLSVSPSLFSTLYRLLCFILLFPSLSQTLFSSPCVLSVSFLCHFPLSHEGKMLMFGGT
ncbi:unnamed protein product [Closterium sp. NIES-65]|nr:unnamed protein product [Closterium sp. NIES-65]